MPSQAKPCVIDAIAVKKLPAYLVFEDEQFIAFLDHRPLFPGHVLVAPKEHFETFYDLPEILGGPLFKLTKQLGKAVEMATKSMGSFIAMNNKVSQSIPHLHVHIVPRNKQDGLKGFFWPRTGYRDEQHILEIQNKIKDYLKQIQLL